jgi:hypothetical protein
MSIFYWKGYNFKKLLENIKYFKLLKTNNYADIDYIFVCCCYCNLYDLMKMIHKNYEINKNSIHKTLFYIHDNDHYIKMRNLLYFFMSI